MASILHNQTSQAGFSKTCLGPRLATPLSIVQSPVRQHGSYCERSDRYQDPQAYEANGRSDKENFQEIRRQ